jgi:hypothetical protein
VDEEPVRAAGFLAQGVHARQHAVRLPLAVELSRDRQLHEVPDLEVSGEPLAAANKAGNTTARQASAQW